MSLPSVQSLPPLCFSCCKILIQSRCRVLESCLPCELDHKMRQRISPLRFYRVRPGYDLRRKGHLKFHCRFWADLPALIHRLSLFRSRSAESGLPCAPAAPPPPRRVYLSSLDRAADGVGAFPHRKYPHPTAAHSPLHAPLAIFASHRLPTDFIVPPRYADYTRERATCKRMF